MRKLLCFLFGHRWVGLFGLTYTSLRCARCKKHELTIMPKGLD